LWQSYYVKLLSGHDQSITISGYIKSTYIAFPGLDTPVKYKNRFRRADKIERFSKDPGFKPLWYWK